MSERPNWEEMTDDEIRAACDAAECNAIEQELERRFREARDKWLEEEVKASEWLEHMRYETRNDGKGEAP